MRRAHRVALTIGVVAAGLALYVAGRPRALAVALGVLFCLLCLVVIQRRGLADGRRPLFSPLVLMAGYMLLGIGVRGLGTLAGGPSKIEGAVDPTSAEFQQLYAMIFGYAIVGLLCLLLGDAAAARFFPAKPEPLPAPRSDAPVAARNTGIVLGLLAAGVLAAKLGSAILLDPTFVATTGTFGLFWLYPLLYAPMYGLAYVYASRLARGEPAAGRMAVAVAGAAAVVYLLTSSKAAILNAALLLLVIRHIQVRPVRLATIALLALLFTITLPVLYLHREFGLSLDLLERLDAATIWRGFGILLNRSYLADSFGAVLRYTPHPYDYQLGRNWLEIFYFWVPRGIWPGKPLSSSLTFAQSYLSSLNESQGSFFSATLLGDAYQNFGPVGIPLLFLGLGLGLGAWYRRLCRPGQSPARTLVYAASIYWIAMSSEQSLEVALELSLSYVAIAGVVAAIGAGALGAVLPRLMPGVRFAAPAREPD